MGCCVLKYQINDDAQILSDAPESNQEICEAFNSYNNVKIDQKNKHALVDMESNEFKSCTESKEQFKEPEQTQMQNTSKEGEAGYQQIENTQKQHSLKIGSSLKIQPEMMVRKQCITEKFMAHYEIVQQLGQGGFGIVYLVRHLATKMIRAAKVIMRVTIQNEGKLLEETEILKQLDHPNIVKILEIFADFKYYYIVTEYCSGGELLDRVRNLTHYNEKLTASYMKQLFSAVLYCHQHNIVHRDLKPENILFDSKETNANLKVIDFGASEKMVENKSLTKKIGTPYYVAPEVLDNTGYDEGVDVWSCGIILYILLCGRPPFRGTNDIQTLKLAKEGNLNFNNERWSKVSIQAQELIQKLIVVNPRKRISIQEAFNDPWIQGEERQYTFQELQLVQSLSQFTAQNKLRSAIFQFISIQVIKKEEQGRWLETFKRMDTNGDGVLSEDELVSGMIVAGENECRVKVLVKSIMTELDVNESGKVDFTEFISAAIILEQKISIENIRQAFQIFDLDGNGQISKNELEEVFGGVEIEQNAWTDILQVCDKNQDGVIQEEEFITLLQNIQI